MSISIDFYYGLGSRYSYLAASQIPRIEQETDCRFVWKPLFSGDLIQRWNRNPFASEPISGQYDWSYRRRDAKRWASYYGIPFHEPKPFSVKPQDLALATLAAGNYGLLVQYSQALFDAIFVQGLNIDREQLSAIATNLGIASADFQTSFESSDTQNELEHLTEEAFRRGAFGVPTFFAGEEMYWGNDRLILLQHHIRQFSAP